MGKKFSEEFSELYKKLFPKLISYLSVSFRNMNIQVLEDIAEESMIKAWENWQIEAPQKPFSWLIAVSRRSALNILLRKKVEKKYTDSLSPFINSNYLNAEFKEEIAESVLLKDEQIKLMFCICETDLSNEKKIVLILRFICGLPVSEIARLYLVSVPAMKKRMTRFKEYLSATYTEKYTPHQPDDISVILEVAYSLFNQGYFSESHEQMIRKHLCYDALSIVVFLKDNLPSNDRRADALIALMCFSISRFNARIDNAGNLLPLDKQDRGKWNKGMIEKGLQHLGLAFIGNETSRYHLEAAINACHSIAESDNTTDWTIILSLYDRLCELDSSPVIRLNRAVAVFKVKGIEAALVEIDTIAKIKEIQGYYLYYAIGAELLIHAKKWQQAIGALNKVDELCDNPQVKRLFREKAEKIKKGQK